MTNYYFIIIFIHFCNDDDKDGCKKADSSFKNCHVPSDYIFKPKYIVQDKDVLKKSIKRMKYARKKLCHNILDDESTKKRESTNIT